MTMPFSLGPGWIPIGLRLLEVRGLTSATSSPSPIRAPRSSPSRLYHVSYVKKAFSTPLPRSGCYDSGGWRSNYCAPDPPIPTTAAILRWNWGLHFVRQQVSRGAVRLEVGEPCGCEQQ